MDDVSFTESVEKAFVMDMGIKLALGFNSRSTTEWKGERPSTRMGVMAILRGNLIKAKKLQNLFNKNKKDIGEIDPVTEVFLDVVSKQYNTN